MPPPPGPSLHSSSSVLSKDDVKNKARRSLIAAKERAEKKRVSRIARKRRQQLREEIGGPLPGDLEREEQFRASLREPDETIIGDQADPEVDAEEAEDEFKEYFSGKIPKIMISCSKGARKGMLLFIRELLRVFPNSRFVRRGNHTIEELIQHANRNRFTDLVVFTSHRKVPNGMILCHLPNGPTATFTLTRPLLSKRLPGHGAATQHVPELILNHFSTRLGRRVGRLFQALFPHKPEFRGRQVVTLHNQRDYIFFRYHRYIFDEGFNKVYLQELGPRFTLKLRSLQEGPFDPKNGEYEWIHKTELDTSRRRYHL